MRNRNRSAQPSPEAGVDAGAPAANYPPPTTEPTKSTKQQSQPPSPDNPLRRSRTSGTWLAVVAFVVLFILLIVFIAQNTRSVQISYFGWDGHAPLAVTVLIATAVGLVLAVAAGSARILQMRRRVKRDRR